MSTKRLSRKPTRIIKAGEIKQYYSMKQAIDAMERAFSSLSSGDSFVPLRNVSRLPSNDLLMLFKPAFVETDKRVAIKFLTQREKSCIMGIPVIQGVVFVIDSETGEILSIMDGEYITALRTGAASGLATRYFAGKDAQTLALFGCGAQGKTQIEAVACERNIKKVLVFDKNSKRAEQFISEMEEKLNLEMIFCKDTSMLAEAEIICTATNSTKPLFRRKEVKKGTHINAIGSFQPHMQELDPLLIKDAKVYVDQAEPCLKESGDFIKAKAEGIIDNNPIVGEIGDFYLKKIPGRESDDEITLFKSVGVAIQDYAVAADIYKFSLEKDFGLEINLFE
ncbi:ornithine cyclodeaminase family protein [Maribellus comscasis]|uniref:Ornithine cyclodeaminase family protein n=1 Tax=Maribellus comscasis TaxID=2681766 RepID=A0A6I6K034_9BACT|nr:ornithine cyclodeaminase family protein [Maribellus comscasis]QGY46800.1 ornithine cyclodeaminase family protein [Maribellus comscasis]